MSRTGTGPAARASHASPTADAGSQPHARGVGHVVPECQEETRRHPTVGNFPSWKVRWILPVFVCFAGAIVQNMGLYYGTRHYVRWMDKLTRPLPAVLNGRHRPSKHPPRGGHEAETADEDAAKPSALEVSLQDPFADWLGRNQAEDERWMEWVVDILPLIWFGSVARARDLRLWTHTLLCGALLTALNGFLAWATIVPTAEGWGSCQARLGADGLRYFRRSASAESESGDVLDIMMLTIGGLWGPGRVERSTVCADALFSGPTLVCVLFGMALYDMARRFVDLYVETLPASDRQRSRFGLLLVAQICFMVVVGLHVVLALLSRHHYTADVVISLVLTLLVYSNPAVAIAAEQWETGTWTLRKRVLVAVGAADAADASLGRVASDDSLEAGDIDEASGRPIRDAGRVLVPPCFVPPCCVPGRTYFLRSRPVRPAGVAVNAKSVEEKRQSQLEHFARVRSQHARVQHQQEALLDEERSHARRRAAEAAEASERRLREALATETQQVLEEAERTGRADADVRENAEADSMRLVGVRFEDQITTAMQRFSLLDEDFARDGARKTADALRAREDAATARARSEALEADAEKARQEADELRGDLARLTSQLAVRDAVGAAQRALALAAPGAGEASF